MYGLINQRHLQDIITEVCKCLGYGSNNAAHKLLLETAGAETNFGTYEDPTIYAGMGITQIDKNPFYDIRQRCSQEDRKRVLDYFGIDIQLVNWDDLRYNPLLAMIFTRLKYKKIPEEIPADVNGRAIYWKEFYNSKLGKGTPEKYLAIVKKYDRLIKAENLRDTVV